MSRIMVHMTDVAVPLVTITESARVRVLEVRAGEPEPESLALWVEVTGTAGDL